jgi:surface protein
MSRMFYKSTFNQDISDWDVSNVRYMNNMFWYNEKFNQNLETWEVLGVDECRGFSRGTSSWSLPKPIFINCNPN